MPYQLIYLDEFANWLDAQEEDLLLRTLAHLELLKERGPLLARPYADTLKGSQIANLKECRFQFEKHRSGFYSHSIQSNKQSSFSLATNKVTSAGMTPIFR